MIPAVENSASPPRVTIGIMTHNYAHYIAEAIESVLKQSVPDWELIISDDASTDGTSEVVKPYLTDPRIRYVRHDVNLGQAGNWAFVLSSGTAPVVAVLHADDQWIEGALDAMLSAFAEDEEIDVVYGSWWRDQDGQPAPILGSHETDHVLSGVDETIRQAKKFTCLVSASAVRRTLIQRAGMPDSDLRMMIDYYYYMMLLARSRKVRSIGHPITRYRAHEGNVTSECWANGQWLEELAVFADRCAPVLSANPETQPAISIMRRGMALGMFSMAVTIAANGDMSKGRSTMRRAIGLNRTILCEPRVILDWLLCFDAPVFKHLFRLLHRNRLY